MLNVVYGVKLVVGFVIRKSLFKFPLPQIVFGIYKALCRLSFGIKGNQIFGKYFHCGSYLVFGFVPFLSAEFIKFNFFSAYIFLYGVHLVYGNKKTSSVGIGNFDVVFVYAVYGYFFKTFEYSYAVARMNNIVANLKVCKTFYGGRIFLFRLFLLFAFFVKNFVVAEKRKIYLWIFKASA